MSEGYPKDSGRQNIEPPSSVTVNKGTLGELRIQEENSSLVELLKTC